MEHKENLSAETPEAAEEQVRTGGVDSNDAAEVTLESAADQIPKTEDEAAAEAEEAAAETEEAIADAEAPAAGSADESRAEASPETTTDAGSGEAATAEPLPSKKRWYVIHTYSGHENKVKANLERAIQYARAQEKFGEILVATEDYAVMKAGKKHISKRKTFPSYVLVEMEMDDEIRALVQNIPGVTHFVGDRRPTPLTEAEVQRIRGEDVRETGKVTTEVPFKVGESVKVIEGPFADFVGTVDEINLERGKLRVMVSIFGRPTAVELDIMHVTSI